MLFTEWFRCLISIDRDWLDIVIMNAEIVFVVCRYARTLTDC